MEEIGGDDDGGGGGGAPGWMATFADLMSLLLAFFVLLFSFSSIDDQLYKEVGGSMKDAFGVQSTIVLAGPVMGINHIAQEFSSGRPDPQILNVVPQENLDLRKKWNSDQLKAGASDEEDQAEKKADEKAARKMPKDEETTEKSMSKEKATEKAKKTQDELTGQMIGQARGMTEAHNAAVSSEELNRVAQFAASKAKILGKELAAEIANGDLSVQTEGNKVIIRVAEEASFPPGSAESYSQFEGVIQKISDVVKDSPGDVVVEGHTDNIPISSTRFRSNWDLSATRAATVVEGLIAGTGLPVERFQVRGMADTRPLDSNLTPKGRAKNRRVEVVLEYDEKDLVPTDLETQIELSDDEKKRLEEEAKEEEEDPLLDLYRGFDKSLSEEHLINSGSSSDSGEEPNFIFRDDFFR
ncbi:MAG: OmpA family protein [Bdellovibrionales bacterium]|nr:OmpA family protein [Bdellovibrionales bacterium]